jgi:hypothetical protein
MCCSTVKGGPPEEGGVPALCVPEGCEQAAELLCQAVEVVGHRCATVEDQRRRSRAATVPPKRPDLERRLLHGASVTGRGSPATRLREAA